MIEQLASMIVDLFSDNKTTRELAFSALADLCEECGLINHACDLRLAGMKTPIYLPLLSDSRIQRLEAEYMGIVPTPGGSPDPHETPEDFRDRRARSLIYNMILDIADYKCYLEEEDAEDELDNYEGGEEVDSWIDGGDNQVP